MLKLISCELAKLKRKKFIPFVILSAFMFPPPVALMMLTPRMMERYDTKAELFDDFYQFVLGYGVELLLPCIIGTVKDAQQDGEDIGSAEKDYQHYQRQGARCDENSHLHRQPQLVAQSANLGNQAPADNSNGGCGQAEDQPEQEQITSSG